MDRPLDPADALAIADEARHRLASQVYMPWWYAPLYGLGCGGLIASHALPPFGAAIGVAVCLIGLAALYVTWSRLSGVSVNGYRAGRTLPITLALVFGLFALGAYAMTQRWEHGVTWMPLACGAVAGVMAMLASQAWDGAWRRDMAQPL